MEYDKIDLVEAKTDKLLDEFKSDSDIAVYTNALYFIIAIFIIAICLLYVYEGYEQLVFSLALLSLIPYKLIIGSAAQKANSLSTYNSIEIPNKQEFATAKISYLNSLVDLKISRLKALRIVYMCCFPVLLYVLSKLFIQREVQLYSEIIYALMALIIGGVFWYVYFYNDINDLEMDNEELKTIISNIQS